MKWQGVKPAARWMLPLLLASILLTGCVGPGDQRRSDDTSGLQPTALWTPHTVPNASGATTRMPTPSPVPSPTPAQPPPAEAVIYGAGDVLLHDTFFNYPPEADGLFDYTECFDYIRGMLDDGYAVADYEGTLGGQPYRGYPRFSGPDEIVPALWQAGFRMMLTANNHTIDTGLAGVQRTAAVFRAHGFATIGTRPDTDAESFYIVDVNGIQVGFAGFTFETPGTDAEYAAGTRALNALPMPEGAAELIDSFNPYREDLYQQDLERLFARVALLRARGAEAVVFFMHWGEDYSWTDDLDAATLAANYAHLAAARLKPSPYVRELAQMLADHGVDVIIGNHPHLVHEIEVLGSAVTGRSSLVYYSTGNLLSAMDYSHNGRYRDGIFARVTLRRDEQGVTTVARGEYIPLYCNRWLTGERRHYQIVPVRAALADPAAFRASAGELDNSLHNTLSILSDCVGTAALPIVEALP